MVGFGALASYPLEAFPFTSSLTSLTANTGVFTLTGTDISFKIGFILTVGSFSYSGIDAFFKHVLNTTTTSFNIHIPTTSLTIINERLSKPFFPRSRHSHTSAYPYVNFFQSNQTY